MRKSIIIGSLLAVFLMMMLPAVSAEESKLVQSARTSPYFQTQKAYLETLTAQYADGPIPQPILLTIAILLLKMLRWGIILFDALIFLIIVRILGGGQNNTTGITC